MDVHINEVQSTVRAVDGDSLLSPQTLQKIVSVVMQAVRDDDAHRERVRAEQRISGGVAREMEESGR